MGRRAGTPTTKKVTQLVNVEEHVEGFRQVREAHRRELIDDYVELISDLIIEVGEARQVDMAARLLACFHSCNAALAWVFSCCQAGSSTFLAVSTRNPSMP